MTADEIIDGLLDREDGWRDEALRPDGTADPPTNWGITLPTLIAWRQRTQPGTVTDRTDLIDLETPEARAIYQHEYIDAPGFTSANIPFEPLRVQLIDFGVNSGPERAIRWLQRVLGLPVTGTLNAETVAWLTEMAAAQWWAPNGSILHIVNDALVAARSYMVDAATDQGSMRKQDEEGVESRALAFFLAKP